MKNKFSQAPLTPIELARLMVASCAWLGRSPAQWGTGATATRNAAIAELRRASVELPPLEQLPGHVDTTIEWDQKRRELRRYLVSRDPSTLLTWNPIVRSMTQGLLPYLWAEFRALYHSGHWESRWKDALRENRAGLPMPGYVYPLSSGTLIHHAYHLYRFESVTRRAIGEVTDIVEFGGGYGSMARLAARLGFRGQYHIHDLPEFSALQRFYLRLVRAELRDAEIADTLSRITFSWHSQNAAPPQDRDSRTLFVATWSLSETPLRLRDEWLPHLANFQFFLIGYRDRFEGIDNVTWFQELAASRSDLQWHLEPIRHRDSSQYYLIGSPR